MKFHKDRDDRSCPTRPDPIEGPLDDSPMIAACYEVHLSMQKMLAVFAELRGDDAGQPVN
jgi:hypothetical protein